MVYFALTLVLVLDWHYNERKRPLYVIRNLGLNCFELLLIDRGGVALPSFARCQIDVSIL